MRLAEIVSSDLVTSQVAAGLGLSLVPAADLLDAVTLRIGAAPSLLVVLGFEHMLAAAGGLAALVDRCPGLRVLRASRR